MIRAIQSLTFTKHVSYRSLICFWKPTVTENIRVQSFLWERATRAVIRSSFVAGLHQNHRTKTKSFDAIKYQRLLVPKNQQVLHQKPASRRLLCHQVPRLLVKKLLDDSAMFIDGLGLLIPMRCYNAPRVMNDWVDQFVVYHVPG